MIPVVEQLVCDQSAPTSWILAAQPDWNLEEITDMLSGRSIAERRLIEVNNK
jgi:hypothetical protein